ncbi:MAG: translesion error-prone DNA polymerase V autoproteolytic subunit [Duncaniella sp.]|nr:translesion error-prone DNA polymerase V autoproteolytic subunit [Duncaniella sp.]
MGKIKLLFSKFDTPLELKTAPEIKAGFPSTADDYKLDAIDFNRDMIRHPESTFYGRVYGDSMINAGIADGDIAVIDRLEEAKDGDIIVAFVNNEFTIKYLDLTHKEEGYIELRPANDAFLPIRVDLHDDFRVWGVVVWTIRNCKH